MNKLLILEFCETRGGFLFVTQLNRAEFEDQDDETRVQYEGFRPGMYVRIEIENVPCEFVLNFDPHYPIILGGLGNSEGNVGYVQVQVHFISVQVCIRVSGVAAFRLLKIL